MFTKSEVNISSQESTAATPAQLQQATAPDGAAAGISPAVARAEAAANQSQSISANSNHPAKPHRAPSNRKSRMASVAVQQKSRRDGLAAAPPGMFASVDYTKHTDEELHNATVAAIAGYKQKKEEADNYAYDGVRLSGTCGTSTWTEIGVLTGLCCQSSLHGNRAMEE